MTNYYQIKVFLRDWRMSYDMGVIWKVGEMKDSGKFVVSRIGRDVEGSPIRSDGPIVPLSTREMSRLEVVHPE